MGDGGNPRDTATAAATPGRYEGGGETRQWPDFSPTARAASPGCELRRMSCTDGSAGFRAGELRRDRRVADRNRRGPRRCVGAAGERREVRGADRAEDTAAAAEGRVRSKRDREDAGLRAWPRAGAGRLVAGPADLARSRRRWLPDAASRSRDRQKLS